MSSDFGVLLDWAPHSAADATALLQPLDLTVPLQIGPWQVHISMEGAHLCVGAASGVVSLLHGHLYGTDVAAIPALYRQHGAALGRVLEGAYTLLVLDAQLGTVRAFTDRAGSHRLYAAHDGDHVALATRADWPGFHPRPLDPAGVAAYLATGNMFGGLTLHQGVRALPRATVALLGRDRVECTEYWTVAPGPLTGGVTEALTRELAALLREATLRRLPTTAGPLHLSLSGGYDSRGLLSMLSGTDREIHTFSYALGTQGRGTDSSVAARLARHYGAQHTTIGAYGGNLLSTVRYNARWGQGVTHFCDEADAWALLATLAPSDVFTGEQPFELCTHPLKTVPEQLKNHHLTGFSPLAWLRDYVPVGHYATLRDAWQAELDMITVRTLKWEHPAQRDLMLMLDQHLPHVLLPWRECYAGRVARVHTPFLDSQVLEFLGRVPLPALADKALFRAALTHLDPQLLRVPIAGRQGYEPDWNAQLIAQRQEVEVSAAHLPSRVDELLDPDLIRTLLRGLQLPPRQAVLKGRLRTQLGRLRRTPVGTRVLGVPGLRIGSVDHATFLMRLLTLREADQLAQSHPAPTHHVTPGSPERPPLSAYAAPAGD
ncbi:asparagine synthase-related protein [Deinococcus yunweiensis]|uniref:asparagine synthase-related protein n=1 Tax=Deinococcus yunweiensis TaxID=367282 RepID=UPI00398E9E9D